MKRFHVHVAVDDIDRSIEFYTTLFATAPTVRKPDYAKWMLDDPRVNFAISQRGVEAGVDHLGIQVEDGDELKEVYERLNRAEQPTFEEKETTCCYAKSDKQWAADPQGVVWETFWTHGESTVYGNAGAAKHLSALSEAVDSPCCGLSPDQRAALEPSTPVIEATSACGCGVKA